MRSEDYQPNTFIPSPTLIIFYWNVPPIWLFHTLRLLGSQEYANKKVFSLNRFVFGLYGYGSVLYGFDGKAQKSTTDRPPNNHT